MNKKFIHLGCEISVDGNLVTIRKPDGSRENATLYLTKLSVDFDNIEKFLRDYIDLKFGESLITV